MTPALAVAPATGTVIDSSAGPLRMTEVAAGFAEERPASPETGRLPDVRQGPGGAIRFLSVTRGALARTAPAARG